MSESQELLKTPLHAAHKNLSAKLVPFAGYDMPVQYPMGVLQEHLWTREHAGLFDVSHMGQCFIIGKDFETGARFLETLCPADILNLKPGQIRYSQFLNEEGGILDDFMVTRSAYKGYENYLYLVVNAACKEQDFALIQSKLPADVELKINSCDALIALQGPEAVDVLSAHIPQLRDIPFMTYYADEYQGMQLHISRSGYTGEDGFEIMIEAKHAENFWNMLLKDERVKPIGLGARDSLRLEAGLCLYGHDIDTTTSPIEAALNWSLQKRRREEGGFPGAARIQAELKEGTQRLRVGILPEGKAPAREGAEIVDPATGKVIGKITSGGFGPTLNAPVAMGYVETAFAKLGTPLHLMVRGKALNAKVAAMPFVPNRYFKPNKSAAA